MKRTDLEGTDEPLGVFYRVFREDKYREAIEQAVEEDRRSMLVDYEDIIKEDKGLAKLLLEDPTDTIPASLNALKIVLVEEGKATTIKKLEYLKPHELKTIKIPIRHIRYTNIPEVKMDQLNADYVNRLVSVRGIVRSAGELTATEYMKTYKCPSCMGVRPIEVVVKEAEIPRKCKKCDGNLEVVDKATVWEDRRVIKLQEAPEGITQGTQPRQLKVQLEGDIAREGINPGDLIEVVGILQVDVETARSYKGYYMRGVNVELEEKKYEEVEITPEDEQAIKELSQDPELEEKVINTIAPRIQGYREVKEGIALQLFSGVPEVEQDKGWVRGDIHLLLVGDPGIGKSQTLTYISNNLAPRSIYTTGAGSTGVGLTATTTMEKETQEWVLEAGPMVIADRGLCCIDEFDKMHPEDKKKIHEALEQQTVSIAKAGVMATLNSRCSVLAGANPKGGRVTNRKTPKQLIDLEDTLISRFDLLFLLEDIPEAGEDGRIANMILNPQAREEAYNKGIDPQLLKKYIAYSRRNINPELDQETIEAGVKYYQRKRGSSRKAEGNGEGDPIPTTPRLPGTLKRLVQARARMFLREEANYQDFEKAVELIEYCHTTVGMDPLTGKLDVDVLEGRTSSSEKEFKDIVKTIVAEKREDMGSYEWYSNPDHREEVIETIKEETRKKYPGLTKKQIEKQLRKTIQWKASGVG